MNVLVLPVAITVLVACAVGAKMFMRLARKYRLALFAIVGAPVLLYQIWLVLETAAR